MENARKRLGLVAATFTASLMVGYFLVGPVARNAVRGSKVTDHARAFAFASPGSDRREFLKTAGVAGAAALASPMAAVADGANSRATAERARIIYGSRVFKLKGAEAKAIAEDENAFTLFISGSYRNLDVKETKKALQALQKEAITAAKKGDKAGANGAVVKFCDLAGLKADPMVPGGNYDPRQRRNPGDPATSEIESQMGSQVYALYEAKQAGAPKPVNAK